MKKSLSIFAFALIFVLCGFAQEKDVSSIRGSYQNTHPTKAAWDILANINLSTATGAAGNAGAVYIPTINKFWVSRWASGLIYELNPDGSLSTSFSTSFTGTRNMCWDGQYVIHAITTNILQKVDPVTHQTVGTITMPSSITARFVSYDPTADGGNGGYWVGNWTTGALQYYLVSKSGAQLNVINNTTITGTYGVAFDNWSPGGPFLWVWSQGAGYQNPQKIYQLNIATGLTTGVEHDIKADFASGDSALAGGLFITDQLFQGKVVIGGCLQGTPDRLFVYEIRTLDAGQLAPFNLTSPEPSTVITSLPNSTTLVTFTWDTSRAGANYKWIFGSPMVPPRLFVMPTGTNIAKMTLGKLDDVLASFGLLPGQQTTGQWDVWAFRGNMPANDSLKATNGPRAVVFKRGIPALTAYNLVNPPDNTTITTSAFNGSPVVFNWTRSGDGTKYKWKFGTNLAAPIIVLPSANSGTDSSISFINSGLDVILGQLGIQPGQEIAGQWSVWAFNGLDSLKASQTFNLILKRQAKGDVLVAYDSTATACRASKDSVTAWLSSQNITFDLFNKGAQTATNVITFRGYKKVIWLGEGTSVMSVVQKDSIKAYLDSGTPLNKTKLIIFSEDIGYQFGRSASTYYDLAFMNNYLGANWVLDRPSTGANQGLIGDKINPGVRDSTLGSWPDVLSQYDTSYTHALYRFVADNSINAVGKQGQNYNVATFGVDIESLRPSVLSPAGSPYVRFVSKALEYVDGGGTGPSGWQMAITVKDNGTTTQNTLVMGQDANATDGIDAALGELSLPPAPPTGIFDVRFVLPITPPDASLKDFRNTSVQEPTWTMTFQPGPSGYPFTLTWNPATLPAGSFTLKDAVTGTIVNVNMKTQNSYTLTNSGITSLKIEFKKTVTGTIPIIAGWNIFSTPLIGLNMAVSTLFPAATSPAYGYSGGYVTADTIRLDKGYWIRYPQAATVEVTGMPPVTTTVPLVQGWNLIGVHLSPVLVSGITTIPAGIINSPFYGYNGGYTTPTSLESGKGYWVRTSAAGVMNLTTELAKGPAAEAASIPTEWGKITVTDRDGKSVTLFTAVGSVNLSAYDLPPVPPAGIFDVRFATQRGVEKLGTEAKLININSAEYPVTIRVESVSVQIRDKATGGKLLNESVKQSGSITISNPAISVLELTGTELPSSFALYQNYPNPFNPTTRIKFALPEKANVTLTIYNQLGEKVAVLVNGELEAGYQTYEWNASKLSSGVYFYEIKTDKFTAVKKLMLIK